MTQMLMHILECIKGITVHIPVESEMVMENWKKRILRRGETVNPAILKNPIVFRQHSVNLAKFGIERTADHYCYHFPHWMLKSLDDNLVELVHPTDTEFYLDPWLIDSVSGKDLAQICSNIVKKQHYSVSFEDSYFLDCFFDLCKPDKTLLLIHIDNHSDRGWFYGEVLDNSNAIQISSTEEILPFTLTENSLRLLRENGILHQGNFLSLFASSTSKIHVVFATDEIERKTPTYAVLPKVTTDSELRTITILELVDDLKCSNFTWQEGPRHTLDSMIKEATESFDFDNVMAHIDLDEYDNPWDGNSVNQDNKSDDTLNVIKKLKLDLKTILPYKPIYTHYCMPTGFFPAKHWEEVLDFLEEFHD